MGGGASGSEWMLDDNSNGMNESENSNELLKEIEFERVELGE